MPPHIRIHIGTVILAVTVLTIDYAKFPMLKQFSHAWNDLLILTMAGLNFVTTYLVLQKSEGKKELFPMLVVASFVFRLLVAVVLLLLVWMLEVGNIEIFAINLIILYLMFLAFELTALLTNLRPNSD